MFVYFQVLAKLKKINSTGIHTCSFQVNHFSPIGLNYSQIKRIIQKLCTS